MKIIHLTYEFELGGIETMLVNIINEQIKKADVSLIIINDNYNEVLIEALDERVNIVNIGRPIGSKNPLYLYKLNHKLWSMNADIIHLHHPGIIRFLIKRIFSNKLVLTLHNIPMPADIPYFKHFPQIYAISKSVQLSLKKIGYKSTLVYNGINPDDFKQRTLPNSSIFKIVQIGRLVHVKKGQDILIKTCNELVKKGVKNIHIDFIGKGPSEKLLKEMVTKYKLDSYISFIGSKAPIYIASHLKDYSLFVQPSRKEGFGLTITEAMAAKVPVLVSQQEGPLEIIDNGRYGYCFEVDNYENCAEVIIKIMNSTNIEELTQKAFKQVYQSYNVKNTANQYLYEYKQYLKEIGK